jgi:hypothetical protein
MLSVYEKDFLNFLHRELGNALRLIVFPWEMFGLGQEFPALVQELDSHYPH